MALSITWGTKVINVLRADMTLIQSVPTEIRELNLNAFRLDLKALEETEDGIVFDRTHNHNTEVLLGGLTYARIVEIINSYTVTFEDGQYAVNLVGANSNVGDVVNVNQVSVRSQNSAGLISSSAIEFSSFLGGVTVDLTSSNFGTVFPSGTPQAPVNNFADALLIASVRGLTKLFIIGDALIDSGLDFSGLTLQGESKTKTMLTIASAADVTGSEFNNATVEGTLDGGAKLEECRIAVLDYVDGVAERCIVEGPVTLSGVSTAQFLDCWAGVDPEINIGGSGSALVLSNYSGEITLKNKTGTDRCELDMASGHVIIDATVTSPLVVIRGLTKITNFAGLGIVDSSDALVPSRVTNLKYLIETLRPHHTGYGDVYYWDPNNGDDTFDGLAPPRARATLQSIIDDLVTDNNHDIVVCLASAGGGNTVVDQTVLIDKAYTFIRGPGRDFIMRPSSDPGTATVHVTAEGVEVSGMRVEGFLAGVPNYAVLADGGGDFALFGNLWVTNASRGGMELDGVDAGIIDSCTIEGNSLFGIDLHAGTTNSRITNCKVFSNGSHGIRLEAGPSADNIINDHNVIHSNGGYGIKIETGVLRTNISADLAMWNNVSGDFIDEGTDTGFSGDLNRAFISDVVWNDLRSDHDGPGSMGESFKLLLGHQGVNVRDDALTFDDDGKLLSARRRIFPDKSTAEASTIGGVGEGEIQTVIVTAEHIDERKWRTLLRTST